MLLQRLEALEQVVFGRKAPTPQEARVDELGTKVVGIAKRVSRVEGGNRDLQHIATQGDVETWALTRGMQHKKVATSARSPSFNISCFFLSSPLVLEL